MTPDQAPMILKARRETIRWFLLLTANVSRPAGIYTEAMLPVIQATYTDTTHREIRTELDYLEERELVKIKRDGMDRWFVELTRHGVDLAEYTTECEPGIARPRIVGA
jgi:DNA-binding transcriptional ArsR family regulator